MTCHATSTIVPPLRKENSDGPRCANSRPPNSCSLLPVPALVGVPTTLRSHFCRARPHRKNFLFRRRCHSARASHCQGHLLRRPGHCTCTYTHGTCMNTCMNTMSHTRTNAELGRDCNRLELDGSWKMHYGGWKRSVQIGLHEIG
jgi:hypothetical protein